MSRLETPVSDQYLKYIGRVAVNHAVLDLTIKSLIWEFLGPKQKIGQIVTAELDFRRLLSLLSSLCRERYKDDKLIVDEIMQLIRRAESTSGKRDKVIHSIWLAGQTSLNRAKITAKLNKGFNLEFEKTTPSDLEKIAEELAILSGDFSAMAKKPHVPSLSELARLSRAKRTAV